jgi:hemerythrin-like domain-containing protein
MAESLSWGGHVLHSEEINKAIQAAWISALRGSQSVSVPLLLLLRPSPVLESHFAFSKRVDDNVRHRTICREPVPDQPHDASFTRGCGTRRQAMSNDALQIIREEHTAVAVMLRSLKALVAQGPAGKSQRFFEVVRSMLFYIDEFPERRHHPNESRFLFPALMREAPELRPVIERLEADHESGERRVRELQHMLTAWEIIGEGRRALFEAALGEYVRFYLNHMRVEETELLPVAERVLPSADRQALDATFSEQRDPLAGGHPNAEYEALFSRIAQEAPAPIGLGDE